MEHLTYEEIKPMLFSAEEEGSMLKCVFKCPKTGETLSATAEIEETASTSDEKQEKKSFIYDLHYSISSMFKKAVGADPRKSSGAKSVADYSADAVQKATVAAFKKVFHRFEWDKNEKIWVYCDSCKDLSDDFQNLVRKAKMKSDEEKKLLARILVSIATSDGKLDFDEISFMRDFLDPQIMSFQQIAALPAPGPDELAKIQSLENRETVVALAWALALTDHRLDRDESANLEFYTKAMNIADDRSEEIKRFAQYYVVEQAIQWYYAKGWDAQKKAKVVNIAQNIGIEKDDASNLVDRYEKMHAEMFS